MQLLTSMLHLYTSDPRSECANLAPEHPSPPNYYLYSPEAKCFPRLDSRGLQTAYLKKTTAPKHAGRSVNCSFLLVGVLEKPLTLSPHNRTPMHGGKAHLWGHAVGDAEGQVL